MEPRLNIKLRDLHSSARRHRNAGIHLFIYFIFIMCIKHHDRCVMWLKIHVQ